MSKIPVVMEITIAVNKTGFPDVTALEMELRWDPIYRNY